MELYIYLHVYHNQNCQPIGFCLLTKILLIYFMDKLELILDNPLHAFLW